MDNIYSFVLSKYEDIEKVWRQKAQTCVALSSILIRDKKRMVFINQSGIKVASKARDTLPALGTKGNYQDKFQDRNLCSRR